MRRRLGIAGLALAVLAVYLASSRDEPARTPDPGPAVRDDPPSPEATAAEPVGEATEDVPSEEDGADTPGGPLRLRGIVVREGAPVAGAEVSAVDLLGTSLATTRSGAGGRFTLAVPDAGYVLQLLATHGENLRGSAPVLLFDREPEIRIELQALGPVLVNVRFARDGTPVSGARVQVEPSKRSVNRARREDVFTGRFGPVATGADGRAAVMIHRAWEYVITAEHERFGFGTATLELAPRDPPQVVTIELHGGSAIRGTVVDEDGEPTSAAVVLFALGSEETSPRFTRTAGEGLFAFGGVPPGRYRVEASATGLPPAAQDVDKQDAVNDVVVELVLEGGLEISGRVLEADDRPAPGWLVRAAPVEQRGRMDRGAEAVAGAGGGFIVRGLAAGLHRLTLRRAEDRSEAKTTPVTAGAGDRDVILRAPAAATLEGEVRFTGAAPPPRYTIRAGRVLQSFAGDRTRFRLERLPPGEVEVGASAPGFAPTERRVELREGETAHESFTLEAGARLTGRVVDRAIDAPIPGANIVVLSRSDYGLVPRRDPLETRSGPDGSFVLDGLSPGPVMLHVDARFYLPANVGPLEDTSEPVVIRLQRGVTVSGRVHRGEEVPRSGAVIIPHTQINRFSEALEVRAELRADGAFAAEGVAPGARRVRVIAQLEGELVEREVALEIPPTGLSGADLDLAADIGRVRARLAEPLAVDLMVTLERVRRAREPALTRHARIAAGEAETIFDGLPAGVYALRVLRMNEQGSGHGPGAPRPASQVTLAEGETADVVLDAP